MTDKELLELAAKAAGFPIEYRGFGVREAHLCRRIGYKPGDNVIIYKPWDPLTDDGDALRLLSHLKMTVAFEPSRGGWSIGTVVNGEFKWLSHDDDLPRSIVCAAAEIGKGMK